MRNFLHGLTLAVGLASAPAMAQVHIEIDHDNPIGTIQPEVYGQFVEHLGTQIYDGIWVGSDSSIPNTDGIRDDVFAALKKLDIPVMRWPGGCYADMYHWRDGIGPVEKRVERVNMAWGGTPEPNYFGTHEFFNLAERLGSKTYLNVNLGSGTVQEAADWLEYITLDKTSALADQRRANGRDKPWVIDYLSIGNETWGCGGRMRAETYADHYTQWATFIRTGGKPPLRVISGSHQDNVDYSDTILKHPQIGEVAEGISVHYYTLPTGDWGEKGAALDFPEAEWMSTLQQTLRMDTIIQEQLAMIDKHDMGEGFGLYVDEWGVWVDGIDGAPALYQQNTIRDAVIAALNLNIFHKYAEHVPMTNIAQMVNVLQAMILTDGPKILLTPTYHVYEMYRPFQGAIALPAEVDSPLYSHGEAAIPAVSASAAKGSDGELVIALTNADARTTHRVTVGVGDYTAFNARILYGKSLDAHNSFENNGEVKPEDITVTVTDGQFALDLPPRSVLVAVSSLNRNK